MDCKAMTALIPLNTFERISAAVDAMADDPILAAEREMRRRAEERIEHLVVAGARILTEEPWRVSRIIRTADELDFPELCTAIAERFDRPAPRDFNDALALKQLLRAIEDERFEPAWAEHRRRYEMMTAGVGQ